MEPPEVAAAAEPPVVAAGVPDPEALDGDGVFEGCDGLEPADADAVSEAADSDRCQHRYSRMEDVHRISASMRRTYGYLNYPAVGVEKYLDLVTTEAMAKRRPMV